MSALASLALAVAATGCLVVVASCLAAVRARDVFTRLHLLSPTTSVGAPLVCLGLALYDGWTLTTGEILLVGLLLALTGPVIASATARVAAQRAGILPEDSPQ